jgi:hypothetical protein
LGYALLARARAKPQEKVLILIVKCTVPELDQFSAELKEQLPVEVDKVLVQELPTRVAGGNQLAWRLAVTTFSTSTRCKTA